MLRRQITFLILIALIVVLLPSCNRSGDGKSEGQNAAAQAGAGPADPQVPSEAREPDTGGDDTASVPMRLTDEGRSRAVESVVVPADPRDSAFESGRMSALPIYARDTELGALALAGTSSARERAIHAVCDQLLDALLEGELPTDLVSDSMGPGGRALLEDLIWASNTLSEARMGRVIELTDAEVSVPFRLIGDERQVVGELIVEKLDEQWYTADIQFELQDRDTSFRFNPSAVQVGNTL